MWSYGPDCEGKDCNTDTYGASFVGRSQEIQATKHTTTAANKHGGALGAGEWSMLQQQIQTGKALHQSAKKLTAAAHELSAAALDGLSTAAKELSAIMMAMQATDNAQRTIMTAADGHHTGKKSTNC
ncbi:unnamed protein product [Vitrella brassicaformis CCMP3155]|uniref:Uncharacterized protein n=1 Tax=Vitrella brassicaformis (strain CCMP3155) TaxID=1169540 RepID=A0A0G4G4X9_VITBC|nr:unnamed protein product [Vitrella brassicaformis CCMP3155]|eukprot:CEM23159.1 unnamed protein product [Vitrella brassicaformis CCMP3155]